MTQNDYPEFIAKLNEVAAIYDKPIEPSKAKSYWSALSNLGIEQFKKAIDVHTLDPKTGQFFPKPADIMKNARPGLGPREIANEAAAKKWLEKKTNEFKTGVPAYSATQINQSGATL